MRRYRFISAIIASLVAALTIAACGRGDGSQSAAAGKEPTELADEGEGPEVAAVRRRELGDEFRPLGPV